MVRPATIRRRCGSSLRLFRKYATKISLDGSSTSQPATARRAFARLFRRDLPAIISDIQTAVYNAKHRALRSEIAALEAYVASQHAEEQTKLLSERSMLYLKNALHRKYGADRSKPIFLSSDLYFKAREVLNEYPVVSSTTFSARNSLSPETTYDYVIMDEASQVSIETGALALSVARNAVIVGDTMQLPNVVTPEAGLKLDEIAAQFTIPESYDCARNSFLESVCRVIPDVPQTLLKRALSLPSEDHRLLQPKILRRQPRHHDPRQRRIRCRLRR